MKSGLCVCSVGVHRCTGWFKYRLDKMKTCFDAHFPLLYATLACWMQPCRLAVRVPAV